MRLLTPSTPSDLYPPPRSEEDDSVDVNVRNAVGEAVVDIVESFGDAGARAVVEAVMRRISNPIPPSWKVHEACILYECFLRAVSAAGCLFVVVVVAWHRSWWVPMAQLAFRCTSCSAWCEHFCGSGQARTISPLRPFPPPPRSPPLETPLPRLLTHTAPSPSTQTLPPPVPFLLLLAQFVCLRVCVCVCDSMQDSV